MNQKDVMKAYEQQRQRKEEIQKRERLKKIKEKKIEIEQRQQSVNQNQVVQTTNKRQQPVNKKQVSQSIDQRQQLVNKKQTTQSANLKQQAVNKKQTIQSTSNGQQPVNKNQATQSVNKRQQTTNPRQTSKSTHSKQQLAKKSQSTQNRTRKVNSSSRANRTISEDIVVRKKVKSYSTKKKINEMSLGEIVEKIPEVAKETKENIQGAIYYVDMTLKNAKEREEREEQEDIYQESMWVEQEIGIRKTNIERAPQKRRNNTSKNKALKWLKKGRRFELSATVAMFVLILVIGGSVVLSLGKGDSSKGESKNPIRDLIDMMDFGNNKNNEDNKPSDEQVGITGDATVLTASGEIVDTSKIEIPEWIDGQFLTVSEYSRPGVVLDSLKNIVIHYVGNPGTTAQNNRDYFENLKDTKESAKSAHFIVGLEGEVIWCVPLNEKSYTSNHRNNDTISIEVCHPNVDGKFSDVTYDAVIKLTAWLCQQFGLSETDIIRHYDVTQKACPKYFVDNPEEWIRFKDNLKIYMEQNPEIK